MNGATKVNETGDAFHVAIAAEAAPSASAAIATGAKAVPEKSLWSYIGLSVSAVLLILVVALGAVAIVIPKLTGAVPMTVLTSSMEPGLPPGTLIIVKPVNPDDLAIGDVATYQMESGKPGVITHRIIAINLIASGERTFEFMGDNNGVADAEAVREIQIQGKLWYSIPLIGWVNNLVNGANKVWIVPVIAGLLFAYAGYMLLSSVAAASRTRRKRQYSAKAERARTAPTAGVPRAEPTPDPLGGSDPQHDLSARVPLLQNPVSLGSVSEFEHLPDMRTHDS